MKNICIRDKFNREISSDINQKINKLNLTSIKFNNLHGNCYLMRDEIYKLRFIFDFNLESEDFLNEILDSIYKKDSKKLIYLCDSYKFRFFKVFDYILDKNIINSENFNYIIPIFLDLMKNGKTKNSLNLSIFILSFFDKVEIYDFCRECLLNDLDYLEVCSFVLRNDKENDELTYFGLFKYFYSDFKIINLLHKLNENYFNSYLKFILSFYLFNVKNLNIDRLDNFELKIFTKYIFNYKKSMNKISGKFLFFDNFDEFKFMLTELNFILEKLEEVINDRNYEDENIDIEFCYLKMCLFGGNSYLSHNKFKDYTYKKLVDNLYERNYRECKIIILIYNILDINISEKINKLFNKEYESVNFLKFVLRVFREYKYFYSILSEFEKNVYLTKFINDFEFRNLIFRSLVVVYNKFDYEIVGCGFLKVTMDYEEFYNEKSAYINFIVQKILERS